MASHLSVLSTPESTNTMALSLVPHAAQCHTVALNGMTVLIDNNGCSLDLCSHYPGGQYARCWLTTEWHLVCSYGHATVVNLPWRNIVEGHSVLLRILLLVYGARASKLSPPARSQSLSSFTFPTSRCPASLGDQTRVPRESLGQAGRPPNTPVSVRRLCRGHLSIHRAADVSLLTSVK